MAIMGICKGCTDLVLCSVPTYLLVQVVALCAEMLPTAGTYFALTY